MIFEALNFGLLMTDAGICVRSGKTSIANIMKRLRLWNLILKALESLRRIGEW